MTRKAKKEVLVVDDEQAMAASFQMVLERAGYLVSHCSDVKSAVKRIKERAPDLLLVDIYMPDQSGLELLDAVRELGISIPAVMISGIDKARAAVEAMQRGAVDYLVKPLSVQDVLMVVRKYLER